jgi:uncharacterized protein (UPF0276 family)
MDLFLNDFMAHYEQLKLGNNGEKVYIGIENLFPSAEGENFSFFCGPEEIEEVFENDVVKSTDLGILIDLGHLAISSNILGFDRGGFIDDIVEKYGDRIYEVHFSENNGSIDQHAAINEDSWQLKVVRKFQHTGSRCSNSPTRFCIESRGLDQNEILDNYRLVKKHMEK